MTEADDMGPGWTKAWSAPNGDAVFAKKESGWIRFDMTEPCGGPDGHGLGSFCAACLGRAERLFKIARHIVAGKKPPEA